MTKDKVGKDYLTSSNINELQHWRKQKQVPHQRDPFVATDYYIQSTEKVSGQAEEKRL
jgi:hypothetical protein